MKSLFALLRVVLLAAITLSACERAPERRPKFYQSPMHPWITSDKPGNCTICGMKLVPVFDEKPAGSAQTNELTLSDASRKALGVATATVTREPLTDQLRLSGILEDDDTKHRVIGAFYDGRIDKVYVQQVGQRVKAGQPLATIYSPELLYVVREFQNSSARGKNDPGAANSRQRLIQYGLAPAQVDALANAQRDMYTLDILAPADGTVLVRNAWQGQYVKNGERLFEIGDLARMWFKAEIYERDIDAIRLGQKAAVTSPAAPGKSFDGVVTFVDPSFDPMTRSTKIRIEVNNPPTDPPSAMERQLPHRAYAEAAIETSTLPVLSVPRSALLRDGRHEIVMLESEAGKFHARDVKVGRVTSSRAEILDGLVEGDKVVVQGNLLIDAEVQLRRGGE